MLAAKPGPGRAGRRPEQRRQGAEDLGRDRALGNVADRAERLRLANHELVLGGAEYRDPRLRKLLDELAQPLQALAVGEIEVEQDGVDIAFAAVDIERFAQRARLEPFERHAEQLGVKRLGAVANELVVVDEKELSLPAGPLDAAPPAISPPHRGAQSLSRT